MNLQALEINEIGTEIENQSRGYKQFRSIAINETGIIKSVPTMKSDK